MITRIIRGAGSPPRPPKPTKDPDTLNSRQFATIQDLISEGEIEGFATPSKAGLTKNTEAYNNASLKDIFLNDTPILDASANNANPEASKFNFQNVKLDTRFGTGNQSHIAGIEDNSPGAQNVIAVGQVPTNPAGTTTDGNNNAVTRQITNTAIDAAKVTITFPQLQKATDKGDLLGSSVTLKIQIQYNGAGYQAEDEIEDTVTGRSADAYQIQYRITFDRAKIDANIAFPIDIRVVRVTKTSDTDDLKDEFVVTSLTEVVDDKQDYLNSAYTQLRLDSEQFSSIPKRAFRIRGIKVRIPGAGANNSGTPSVNIQTGRVEYPSGYIFNGTMGAAQWCSCPALILLDLLTTKRYGFGEQISPDQSTDVKRYENLDLFSFIAASKYANELVDDQRGGLEPRFSCNVNIQSPSEAFKLINELAGVMRCFPIWSEGSVTITQDRPTDASYLFSLANVGEGGFSYSGSSAKQRHSIISVAYFNMDSREIDYEVVGDDVSGSNTLQEDIDRQNKFGIVRKDIKAFACTSRGQARRLGKAVLLSEEQETEVVSFTTSIDAGAIVRPGSVINVNDPVKHGQRRSGRVKTATSTQITVDNVQDLSTFTGTNKKCSVIMPDGTVELNKPCSVNATTGVISLNSGHTFQMKDSSGNLVNTSPNNNSIWLLQSDASGEAAQSFRVITVEEQDGINFAITALAYRAEKYAAIDSAQSITLPDRNISLFNTPKDPPQNVKVTDKDGFEREMIVEINKLAVSKLLLTWIPVVGVTQYLVQYRFENTNWVSETVFRPDFELLNTDKGLYEFKVFSVNAGLKLSTNPTTYSFNALGKTEPPANVENLTMEPLTNKNVRLRWTRSTDPDVLHGGLVYVRHSSKTDGSGTFQNSQDLIPAVAGSTTEVEVASEPGEYILKFRDDQGNFSLGEASVILDLPDLIDTQQILVDNQHPNFTGTKTNLSVITANNSSTLQLTNPANNLQGDYIFPNIIDLNGVFSLNLQRLLESQGIIQGAINNIDQLIPDLPPELGGPVGGGWDNYAIGGNFDGPQVNDVSASLEVRTTDLAPSNGTSYVDSDFSTKSFNTFVNGTFKARGFQFRLTVESETSTHNIEIAQLAIKALFEARTEQKYKDGSNLLVGPQNNLNSSSNPAPKTVVFANSFFTGTSTLGGTNAFLPSVGITIQNAQAGDFFSITNLSGSEFTINIKNPNETNNNGFVNRTFTFQAVGYGKGV
tara:strand:+ start:564 stop:4211 length:3648 start_codon:yes stop_codon:yes gene_type:complete